MTVREIINVLIDSNNKDRPLIITIQKSEDVFEQYEVTGVMNRRYSNVATAKRIAVLDEKG